MFEKFSKIKPSMPRLINISPMACALHIMGSLLLSCLLLLSACTEKSRYDKPTITVTIEPLRYFTEQIAADRFQVVTMVPRGGSPETYEPSAQQMTALAHSSLYIKVGEIGFERTWTKRLQDNAPHCLFVNASEGIAPLSTPHGHADPHTWMSAKNARLMAQNIFKALCEVNAADSALFRKNLNTLLATIDSVDANIRQQLASKPQRAFLIYHPVLTYYAHEYGLKQITLEEESHEPSAADLQRVTDAAHAQGVSTFFVQREFANANIKAVQRELNCKQVDINPLGYQWDKEMTHIAQKLK